MKPSHTEHYLTLHTKILACHSLETGQDLRFIVENVRLLAHQLN
jgi:hypothetical protein